VILQAWKVFAECPRLIARPRLPRMVVMSSAGTTGDVLTKTTSKVRAQNANVGGFDS